MNNERQSAIQEAQYAFPYHHIPVLDGGRFSQTAHVPWGYEYISYTRFIMGKIAGISSCSLIDVGCGDGAFLAACAARFKDMELSGVDMSARAIAFARAFSPAIHFSVMDGKDIPAKASYDRATLIEVLEHIPPVEVAATLAAICGALKGGGIFVVSVPSVNVPLHAKHYRHFDAAALREVLAPHFEITECFFTNSVSFPVRMIAGILSNRLFLLTAASIVSWLYRFYVRYFFFATERSCGRIIAVCRKNTRECP
jgi:SAM-dependent methyltransferase